MKIRLTPSQRKLGIKAFQRAKISSMALLLISIITLFSTHISDEVRNFANADDVETPDEDAKLC